MCLLFCYLCRQALSARGVFSVEMSYFFKNFRACWGSVGWPGCAWAHRGPTLIFPASPTAKVRSDTFWGESEIRGGVVTVSRDPPYDERNPKARVRIKHSLREADAGTRDAAGRGGGGERRRRAPVMGGGAVSEPQGAPRRQALTPC